MIDFIWKIFIFYSQRVEGGGVCVECAPVCEFEANAFDIYICIDMFFSCILTSL